MARQTISLKCKNCDSVVSKSGISRHLLKCTNPGIIPNETAYLLKVESRYNKSYCLFLAASKGSTLEGLDDFLRSIWLECCNHISTFYIGEGRYDCNPYFPDESEMDIELGELLSEGQSFRHIYDFGDSTYLDLKVVALVEVPAGIGIELLARNLPPAYTCDECGKKAGHISLETNELYCDACSEDFECLPLANSPRVGICGYTGEDE